MARRMTARAQPVRADRMEALCRSNEGYLRYCQCRAPQR